MKSLILRFVLVFTFGLHSIMALEPIGLKVIKTSMPAGKYRIQMIKTMNCNPHDAQLQFNLYKMSNSSEVKGNYTINTPIDDTMDVEVSFSIKDSFGGWKDNVFIQKTHKICTTIKNILGNEWPKFMNNIGQQNGNNCPIATGTYVIQGLDISTYKDNNIPKIFIYGTYKVRFSVSRKNEQFGCMLFILEIKRP